VALVPLARFHAFVALLTVLLGASLTAVLHAEPVTLAGRWSASPLTVKWIIGDWGASCGPQPSGGGEGAAGIIVDQTGGELTLSGGGRTFSTSECWEQYPGMQRVGHSSSARAWKSTCRTTAGDPRQASLTTSITATDDHISFYEAGQYQFVIQGQNCTASVGRYRTYTLVQRAGTPVVPSASSSASVTGGVPSALPLKTPGTKGEKKTDTLASNRCASPGPAARLEVRPARKLMRAGEQFSFRALVYDSAGCGVYVRPSGSLESGGELAELTAAATVKIRADAPAGDVVLTVSVGGRSARVSIEVVSADRYENLLRSGTFNTAGEVDEAASVAIASQSIGAASAVAADHASDRKRLFVAVVAGVALLLALAGIFLVRRTRRAAAAPVTWDAARRTEQHASAAATAPASATYAPESTPPDTPRKTICPVCGEQYAAESRFCGRDGAILLPLN